MSTILVGNVSIGAHAPSDRWPSHGTEGARPRPRVADFASYTLGDLADASLPLRSTAWTYLRHHSNATTTTAALSTHRNTIITRMARAEPLLPRPLHDSAFEVGVALEILRWSAIGPSEPTID